jgi:L-aspartate oxidase
VRAHPNIQLMERFNAVDLITTRKLGLPGNKVLEPMSGIATPSRSR